MRGLILCLLFLTGCVSTSGGVSYSIQIKYLDGKIIQRTEEWTGRSNTTAIGDSGIKASQKNIDFGIDGGKIHLKADSRIEDIETDISEVLTSAGLKAIIAGSPIP